MNARRYPLLTMLQTVSTHLGANSIENNTKIKINIFIFIITIMFKN
jgi:hypothetical protein